MSDEFLRSYWRQPPERLRQRFRSGPLAESDLDAAHRDARERRRLVFAFMAAGVVLAIGLGYAVTRMSSVVEQQSTASQLPAPSGTNGGLSGSDAGGGTPTVSSEASATSSATKTSHDSPTGTPRAEGDTALYTEEEALAAALKEIPSDVSVDETVVRLIREVDAGKWSGSCLNWVGDHPVWLVGLKTSGTSANVHQGYPGAPTRPEINFYSVILGANAGSPWAWSERRNMDHSADQGFDSIVALTSQQLEISFQTPRPPITGMPTGSPKFGSPEMLATVAAMPTREAECRLEHW